ncbi:testicular haploid expressed gene protein isoform X1 [Nannospalax galili]|uniref:Sperm microtubule associated protein 2 n=1 Tax=Nannospalax galili TaxID=1026970 RepID=A0A8C6RXS2_NANGA|nr:testicular haploid expressed gene protein isoform X1 [Nannospalax galili]
MGELGEHRPSLLNNLNSEDKALGGSEQGTGNGSLGIQSTVFESHWLQGSQATEGLSLGDPEEEIPPEEVARAELPEATNVEASLNQDLEVEVEMSQLSITEKTPSVSTAKGRRKKCRRLMELAKPKTNWKCLRDRTGCCCKGYAWITPRKSNLQFCLYWPSVYWTERFLEDTTLTVTVPEVSCRVEELSRPKRFYLEYYNNNRTTPVWPIPRSTLEYQASNRLKQLATPKVRNSIWSIDMSEVSRVSRAAQMAVATPRILQLAKPRPPATLLEEWDPMPKPKPVVSDYKRLLQLAMPKAVSEKCVLDRSPQWEVLDVTKKAVATSRIISLAQPKIRKDFNEGYDPYYISPASLVAQATPRLYELATPKYIVKKV